MTRQHDVQALWIVENDGIVNASTPQKYLIENAVKEGIPLLAPTKDWVDAGAPLAIGKANGEVEIMLNEPAADATGLQVPNEYKSRTQPVVAAN
jgi:putative ABC transport system substrate-binding protein